MKDISAIVAAQRQYFQSQATKPLPFRIEALRTLEKGILEREEEIEAALKDDLNKAPQEVYMTETGIVLSELRHAIKHLHTWAKMRRVRTPLANFPAKSVILAEPYGVALIMSPWNYPLQLTLTPLIGAIAAGNCATVKPSAYAPATSALISDLLAACFEPEYIAVIEGGRKENSHLLQERFDYVFFTGSPTVGKLVMSAAAEHLTPLTLELGGKSPCIVHKSANIPLAARRIAFGKFLNAGQTCVAPDYLLLHDEIKTPFLAEFKRAIGDFFGEEALANGEYPRIVNEKHYERLCGLMEGESIFIGGASDSEQLRIAPTVLDEVDLDAPVMGEEIFGPILPLRSFSDIAEAIDIVHRYPKPLACYLFAEDQSLVEEVLGTVSFGGGCVNDTIVHLASTDLPFGGVGESGLGSYHGKASFDTFTHYKSVLKRGTRMDPPMRYHPYDDKKMRLIKRFLK